MNYLKIKFDWFYSNFQKRRKIFEEFIQKTSGKTQENAKNILISLENLGREINEIFSQSKQASMKELRQKIKKFKEFYKEINEIRKPAWRQWFEALIVVLPLIFVLRNFVFGLYHVPTGSAEYNILVGDRLWGNKVVYFFNDVQRGDCVIFDNPEFFYDKSNPIKFFWQKYIGFGIPFLGLPNGPDNWVKRVVAIPGDTIEGRIEDGKTVIYRNGEKLKESYVNPYPLIRLIKTTGFFDFDFNLGLLNFLRLNRKIVDYTYVPDIELSEQPFYFMTKNEIYRNPATWEPVFRKPYTPTYNEFGQNVDLFGPIKVPEGKYWVMGDSRKNSRDSRFWGFLDKSLVHGRASFIIYSLDSEEPIWLFELLKHPIDFWTKYLRWNRTGKSLSTSNWQID
ncbi:MAG: signal peptidase I [bacterium]